MKQAIYFDYNATTPCDSRVLEKMLPYFSEKFGNAASHTHQYGRIAAAAVDEARQQVAQLINADPVEIVFTSGATESANLALKGIFERYASKGNHIITCITEHNAVLDTCAHLEKQGAKVDYLPVNHEGLINIAELKAAIRPETILIAIMYANNETGVLQNVKEISEIARRHKVLFFTDATQAVGKIPVNVQEDGIDLMAFSGHKIYGPKGIGVLYIRRKEPRVQLTSQMDGGGHERGFRSGTLNVPAIVGLGEACTICEEEMKEEAVRLKKYRDQLEQSLLQLEEIGLNGSIQNRLPHITNIAFGYIDGNNLITAITKKLAVSNGSACTSALPEPSHVLMAMGLSEEQARSSLRFGLGRFTTEVEVAFAIDTTKEVVNRLRAESIQWELHKEKVL